MIDNKTVSRLEQAASALSDAINDVRQSDVVGMSDSSALLRRIRNVQYKLDSWRDSLVGLTETIAIESEIVRRAGPVYFALPIKKNGLPLTITIDSIVGARRWPSLEYAACAAVRSTTTSLRHFTSKKTHAYNHYGVVVCHHDGRMALVENEVVEATAAQTASVSAPLFHGSVIDAIGDLARADEEPSAGD